MASSRGLTNQVASSLDDAPRPRQILLLLLLLLLRIQKNRLAAPTHASRFPREKIPPKHCICTAQTRYLCCPLLTTSHSPVIKPIAVPLHFGVGLPSS